MSNPDSFIQEVSEEVRRDRLFGLLRRYGWIAGLAVALIVGGAAWREWSAARDAAQAQALGDEILAALEAPEPEARVAALETVDAPNPGADALVALLAAAEAGTAGDDAAAVARLRAVTDDAEVPQVYRQIARYKALARGGAVLDIETRRTGFEALASPGQPLRLLAEEQLALIDIEAGDRDAALDRLSRLAQDSEAGAALRQRARQLMTALGGAFDAS